MDANPAPASPCYGSSDVKLLLQIGAFKFRLGLSRPQASAASFIKIDPGFADDVRSLYQSNYLLEFFYALFPQVLRGSRKCWHLWGVSPVCRGQL